MAIKYVAAAITGLGIVLLLVNTAMGLDALMFNLGVGLIIGGSLLEVARRNFWTRSQL